LRWCMVDRHRSIWRSSPQSLSSFTSAAPRSVEPISSARGATLLVVSANRRGAMPELVLEAADIPVMLVPDRP
jgi:hypothetical protein